MEKLENLEKQESIEDFSGELKDLGLSITNQPEVEVKTFQGVMLDKHKEYEVCDNPLTKNMGVKTFDGHKETYYTSNPKARPHFNIHKTARPVPGVHIAEGDGTVRDEDGYIVLACNGLNFGDTIMTSRGPGKVYDRGGMKKNNHIDIFTNR